MGAYSSRVEDVTGEEIANMIRDAVEHIKEATVKNAEIAAINVEVANKNAAMAARIESLLDDDTRPDVFDVLYFGIAIGVADTALVALNNKGQEPQLCGVYGWLIASIECSIKAALGNKSLELFHTVLEQKSNLLGENNMMKQILETKPVELVPVTEIFDFHTELIDLINSDSINDVQTGLARSICALTAEIDDSNDLQSLKDSLQIITAHMQGGMGTTECKGCHLDLSKV